MAGKKTCFIICPIGKPDSEERNWANSVRKNIIEPAVTECGYEKPIRSDDPDTGLLMVEIIEQMFEADLVVADLTYYEPNVFFELGIRHCAQKPVIHLIKAGEKIPFDIEENKAISLDKEYDKVLSTREEIKQRIKAIHSKPMQFYTQVQQYIELKQLKLFKKSQTGTDGVILEALANVLSSVSIQRELINNLHKELVEKPKQLPTYGQAAPLSAIASLSIQDAFQQGLLQALKGTEKKLSQKSAIQQALEGIEKEASQEDEQKQ